jgi:hypothetical protein
MNAGTVVAVPCRLCGESVVLVPGRRGRPASYCDGRCRRRAEFRVRALRRRHARLEMQVRVCGVDAAGAELVELERELALLGVRVRALFVASVSPPA